MMPDRGDINTNIDDVEKSSVNGSSGYSSSLNRSQSCFVINKTNLSSSSSLASNEPAPQVQVDAEEEPFKKTETEYETNESSPSLSREESLVFPSLSSEEWRNSSSPIDTLSEKDIESRYSILSMCFKSDKHTLETRNELLQKQREQAEVNANKEFTILTLATNRLRYYCQEDPSYLQMIAEVDAQIEIVQKSISFVASAAENLGGVREEFKVSNIVETMFAHVENLKRLREKDRHELEELKRNLLTMQDPKEPSVQRSPLITQRQSLSSINQQRRASIAAMPRPPSSLSSLSEASTETPRVWNISTDGSRTEQKGKNQSIRNSNMVRRHSSQPVGISSPTPSFNVFGESSSAPVTPAHSSIFENILIEEVSRESPQENKNNLEITIRQTLEEEQVEDCCEEEGICEEDKTHSLESKLNFTTPGNNDNYDNICTNNFLIYINTTIFSWISQIRENFPQVTITFSQLRHAASAMLILCAALILGFCFLPNISSSESSVT